MWPPSRTAREIPEKLLHALEILGPLARDLEGVRPEITGTVGASPAATAAWLSEQGPAAWDPSRRFLETAVRFGAGAVPCGLPITVFERGWVLSGLARVGISFDPHPELVLSLSRSLGTRGAPAAAFARRRHHGGCTLRTGAARFTDAPRHALDVRDGDALLYLAW